MNGTVKLIFAVDSYIFRRRQLCLSGNCLNTGPKRLQKGIPQRAGTPTEITLCTLLYPAHVDSCINRNQTS